MKEYQLVHNDRVIATNADPAPLFVEAIRRGWVGEWERYGAILKSGVEIRPIKVDAKAA